MQVDLFDEKEIIKGCQQENRRSQEILYRRFAAKMYGICQSYAGDRALAQDMLQEAFIKVFKNINEFKGEGSVEGWIRRIVVNTAIDFLRQRQRSDKFINEDLVDVVTHVDNEALPSIHFNEMLGYIDKLPDGARLVFNLFALEGFTHKEIAKELSISEGTSKSQYNRARNLLMNWLDDFKTEVK
jgi:RNA polymerase sigma-70 factor (ECF subfamily)